MPKILSMDDEIDMCQLLERFFSKQGYEFVYETNPYEFINVMKKEKPDLILLDINFGVDMDGINLLSQIRDEKTDAKIIMLSGLVAANDYKEESFRLGVDDYLVKPVDPSHLINRVRELLVDRPAKKDTVSSE